MRALKELGPSSTGINNNHSSRPRRSVCVVGGLPTISPGADLHHLAAAGPACPSTRKATTNQRRHQPEGGSAMNQPSDQTACRVLGRSRTMEEDEHGPGSSPYLRFGLASARRPGRRWSDGPGKRAPGRSSWLGPCVVGPVVFLREGFRVTSASHRPGEVCRVFCATANFLGPGCGRT